jgi:hypothetical protein
MRRDAEWVSADAQSEPAPLVVTFGDAAASSGHRCAVESELDGVGEAEFGPRGVTFAPLAGAVAFAGGREEVTLELGDHLRITDRAACSSSTANTPRGITPPSATARPSTRTSSGPRIENCIARHRPPYSAPRVAQLPPTDVVLVG